MEEREIRRGDIYYADLSPVVGSEQGGIRPVLVIQNNTGNAYSPTVIVAAVTSKPKTKLPTHVILRDRKGLEKNSVVLLEQVRTIDKSRLREYVGILDRQQMLKIIRDFHPHTLRHTFATRCFENKMEPKVVQSLLGHSSISITLNIYTHVLDNKMDEEIKKFGVAKTQNDPYSEIDVGKVRITAKSHY